MLSCSGAHCPLEVLDAFFSAAAVHYRGIAVPAGHLSSQAHEHRLVGKKLEDFISAFCAQFNVCVFEHAAYCNSSVNRTLLAL